ncbi:MAG: FlgD immunoglobulin-like domain containing protein [Calditrichota bacterium]
MDQNYPNPFNPTTSIGYALKENTKVVLKIYNLLGQEVRTLVNGNQEVGYKKVAWDGMNDKGTRVASGIYIYRIKAGDFVKARKMILMK